MVRSRTRHLLLCVGLACVDARGCLRRAGEQPLEHVLSPLPRSSLLPRNWDWRSVSGQSLVSNVLTQQNPHVCGSCWAEAATGALSDRYRIATNGTLQVNLAVQVLLNYDASMSGGSCFGGDDLKAAEFIHRYGISDDTCAPFQGTDFGWGFDCCDGDDKTKAHVRAHMCHYCDWSDSCRWLPDGEYQRYGADEYGKVSGEEAMMQEIYARGPIACSLDSGPDAFDLYKGGIITDSALSSPSTGTDHVVVIAGFGLDEQSGMKYWVGRNSYGTRWGEGRGGGWFRLQRGNNTLFIEKGGCSWAVPAKADVSRIMTSYQPTASESPLVV